MHTKDFLAQELRKVGLNEMADRAATGYYHDFLSPLATPCLQLEADLREAAKTTPAAEALRQRHIRGEFDASKEESDEWMDNPEASALLSDIMKK